MGTGAYNAKIFTMNTRIGTVYSTGNNELKSDVPLANMIQKGHYIMVGNYWNKAPTVFKVLDINSQILTLDRNFNGTVDGSMSIYRRRTVSINTDDDGPSMKTKLETLPGVGSVEVVRTGPNQRNEYTWTITFTSLLGALNTPCESRVPCLAAYRNDHTGEYTNAIVEILPRRPGVKPVFFSALSKETAPFVNEIQEIKTSSDRNDISGYFTVKFSGPGVPFSTNATMKYNITSHDMQYVLEKMHTIGRVKVSYDVENNGSVWKITFLTATLNLPKIQVDGTHLYGTNAQVVSRTIQDGSWPQREFEVPVLKKGETYYTRISASNIAGYGPTTEQTQNVGEGVIPLFQRVEQQPLAPTPVSLKQLSSSQIEVRWADADDQGSPVQKYKIEWWTAPGTPEVQIIQLKNTKDDTMGYFTLIFNGQISSRLDHNASAGDVKHALENLRSIEVVDVVQSTLAGNTMYYGFEWAVTFTQVFVGDGERFAPNAADLTYDDRGLIGSDVEMEIFTAGASGYGKKSVSGKLPSDYGVYEMDASVFCGSTLDSSEQGTCAYGTHEVQTILTSAESKLAGTFKVSIRGMRTPPLAYNASAAQIKEAIENIDPVRQVEVTRVVVGNGHSWFVTFVSDDGPMDNLVAENDYLIGDDATVEIYDTFVITSGSQRDDISGKFRIHIGNEFTTPLL